MNPDHDAPDQTSPDKEPGSVPEGQETPSFSEKSAAPRLPGGHEDLWCGSLLSCSLCVWEPAFMPGTTFVPFSTRHRQHRGGASSSISNQAQPWLRHQPCWKKKALSPAPPASSCWPVTRKKAAAFKPGVFWSVQAGLRKRYWTCWFPEKPCFTGLPSGRDYPGGCSRTSGKGGIL